MPHREILADDDSAEAACAVGACCAPIEVAVCWPLGADEPGLVLRRADE